MVKRIYDDACGAAHGLELVGERWALLVVRELLFGPKRFTDLRVGLPGASPNVLAQRLRELESVNVVRRRRLAPPAAARVYELTDWGHELEPVITALGRWGGRSPSMRRDAPISVDSLVLALKTMFDPEAAVGFDARVALRMGEDRFRLEVSQRGIFVARGEIEHPQVVLDAPPGTLKDVIWNGRDLEEATAAGDLAISGDRALAERLFTMFPLPEPVGAA
jgi:DNA-binding HxlR family transcriptional regulator